ncbi:uncharacterized protein [Littorina saxatilis]|uniref:uncharacterized protein n=1 Tax=Littorina saxatilis TaxID=31220 RepID=UPI0038B439B6
MCYRGHYIFETVRPRVVYEAARCLANTPLFREHGVTTLTDDWLQEHPLVEEPFVVDPADRCADIDRVEQDNQPVAARETSPTPAANENDPNAEKPQEEEEWDETVNDDPVNPGVDETLLDCDEAIRFAPGEGQRPLSVVLDADCEELSFPTIYAGHRRGQPESVSYAEIAKSEARRYDRRATKVPKLFFSYKKMEMIRIASSVQTCLRKKTQDRSYTARDILEHGAVENMVSTDQGFHVLRPVRGSPPFWEEKKKELLAMVRQLGCPTFFFTVSAAETKWKELLAILFRIEMNDDPEPEEIEQWTFLEKAELIRDDPVTCARYFDHRFRALFNTVMRSADGPLGEITDFFYRVEFQHRGSPHIHGLLWIKDAPVYDPEKEDGESEVTSFIDRHITCHVPQENEPLHEEVKLQQHKHSHTCLKQSGKEKICRFKIPKFPMSETRILAPLTLDEVSDKEKERLRKLAQSVKDRLKDLPKHTTITHAQFLQELGCTEDDYLLCIRTTLKRAELFLKRGLGETRSNAYNPDILALWRANMDIQFVLDPYACVMYIINYVGKSQRGMSALLRNAVADVRKGNGSVREKLRAVANCFLNSSEISAQETCYYLLRMPVSQASRACVFINTSRPEKRVRMLKAQQILKEMNPESTDVMSPGLLDKYVSRPESMDGVSLAEFVADYNINSKDPVDDQPHDDEEHRADRDVNTDQRVKLNNGHGFVTKRRWSKVIRYCNFNKLKDEDDYYREQLMLFHPWRNEEQDLISINRETKFKTHEDSISRVRCKYVSTCDTAVREALDQQDAGGADDEVIEEVVPTADLDAEEMGPEEEDFQAMEDEQGRQVDVMEQVGQPARREDADRFLAPGRIPEDEFEQLLSTLNKTQIVGDLNQLPPVGDSFPFASPRARDAYAELVGPVLWEKFRLLELTEIMRQRNDLLFARALGNLVKGKLTEEEKNLLKSRQVQPEDVPEDVLHLFQTNEAVDKFNEDALRKLDTQGATFHALDTCQGDASESMKQKFKEYVSSLRTNETYGLPYKLTLKVSGRYMMTNNVDTADGLVNGATGRLRLIQLSKSGTERKPVRVWIEFDDHDVGRTMRGNNKRAAKNLNVSNTWTPVDYVCRVARRKQGGGNLQILRKQFPLVPAMAITIHKSQGDTYSRVAVHLTRSMKRASLYVACSRAKTAEGLYLVGELHPPSEPSATDKVVLEMARLRKHRPIIPCIQFLDEHDGPELKIGFHNVQSLPKHHMTMCGDASLMTADILCFVETRVLIPGGVQFSGFDCVFERSCSPYGTAVYVKSGVQCSVVVDTLVKNQGHVEVTTVSVEKEHKQTLVTAVYKSPRTPRGVLQQVLTETLDSLPSTVRHVCLGDFNVDRKKPEGDSLTTFMLSKTLHPLLPPDCSTTNQGTQIDQCFTNIPTASAGTVYLYVSQAPEEIL